MKQEIFTIDITYGSGLTEDIMQDALTGTDCFLITKDKMADAYVYTIGSYSELGFYKLGVKMGQLLTPKRK